MKIIRSEIDLINRLTGGFTSSPRRRNAPHEADAELLDLSDGWAGESAPLLAVTTDTISEEITTGLYRDPYQIGWMIATVNLSDLAAVGARPLGLLVSETLTDGLVSGSLERLQQGISDACSLAGTHVLGGDTNFGTELSITGTAIGLVSPGPVLTRKGAVPGDLLFTSGRPGRGNGFALSILGNDGPVPFQGGYFPHARLGEGALLRGTASCCMDTSDGFFSTLDQIGTLNGVGFRIAENWEDRLDVTSLNLIRGKGLPPWLLLAGCHGEFELVFTVAASSRDILRERAAATGWNPIEIGSVTGRPGVVLPVEEGSRSFDVTAIRNLSFRQAGGIGKYLEDLLGYEQVMVKGGY